ncbi:MAG: methionine--tRNA ligase [Pirellulaceae bacterium]|nr:methionine--tRNA ligase [Pirellulaceae bacterium]
MTEQRILVTAALPYANGPIHIGHLLEYIQTDIWVRFQKLAGKKAVFICADDTHGTAIMIRAKREGITELDLIQSMQADHLRDFTGFDIAFDHYGSTNSRENYDLCCEFWAALRSQGLIAERDVSQLFDPVAGTFLADRFVKGTCPKCKSEDQYGDSCEKCGETYSPTELIDPRSMHSGAVPEIRTAPHLFVQLEKMHTFLDEWTQSGNHLQSEVANYLKGHFLCHPLRDWDISRPAPYFGFEIPDAPGNFWYVWFDAPIGYIASTHQWCKANDQLLDDWWKSKSVEIHHFIGKDIQYFHTLFWPGMLKAAGYSLPEQVHIHGFLTVAGEKMSKSKGTFVKAETYLQHLDPSHLRYYYASKLATRSDDIDLNIEEFVNKANSDLVGKVVNLASRTARFIETLGLSPTYPHDGGLFKAAAVAGQQIADAYSETDYARAMRTIMALADAANGFVENAAPWSLKKEPSQSVKLQEVCTIVLNLFRQLAIYLAPVLPRLADQCGQLLGDPITDWKQSQTPLVGRPVAKFEHMLQRIKLEDVEAMIESGKEEVTLAANPVEAVESASAANTENVSKWSDSDEALKAEPLAETCSIEDFAKIDLRVARVLAAEHVPDAKKLLKLTLSLGGDDQRTVFAGIKAAYEPEKLVGRLVIMVANLAPRQMKFGLSQGMVAAAGAGGVEVYLLSPDEGAKPGHRVH